MEQIKRQLKLCQGCSEYVGFCRLFISDKEFEKRRKQKFPADYVLYVPEECLRYLEQLVLGQKL